jgi:hypothetical protein
MTSQEYLDSLWRAVEEAEAELQLRTAIAQAAEKMKELIWNSVDDIPATDEPEMPDEPEWRPATKEDIGEQCRMILKNEANIWLPATLVDVFSGGDQAYVVALNSPAVTRIASECQVQVKKS